MALAKESIASVLQSKNRSDLKKVLPQLLDEIDYYKSKTQKFVDGKYVDFLHQLDTEAYTEEIDTLIGDSQIALGNDDTVGGRESLSMADIELQQYKNEVRKICMEMQVLKKILRVDSLLEEVERCTSNSDTLGMMDWLAELNLLINDDEDTIFCRLACYESISERFEREKSVMEDSLKHKFGELVQMSEKQFQTNKLVCLLLTKDAAELKAIITALLAINFKSQWICDFLLENILVPIITRPVSLERNDSGITSVELKLSYSVKERTQDDLKPKYQVVFRNLRTVLQALHDINVFKLFGDYYLQSKFLRTLIDDCLMDAVPETMDDMKETTLVDDVLSFHQFLVDITFYDQSQAELTEFSQKVQLLFRHRLSTGILNSAVAIMRKDISDMVLMAPTNSDEAAAGDEDDANLTIFPRCMVSKSTVELINLMSKIMREIDLIGPNEGPSASGDSEPTRIQLLSIISVILDRYITEVPSHHEKLLTRIPHLTALFYNNCAYLAFWVGKRESILNMSSKSKLLIELKRIGSEYLTEQVASQRSQVTDIMKEFDLNDSLTELSQSVYRCVRQCLRQMDLLKNVWQSILPDACYNSTMGTILSDFVAEVIRKIMTLEDIATPIANGLVDVISLIVERAPLVFAVRN